MLSVVIATVRPHMLDPVCDALSSLGVSGLTVSEVSGFGRQKGHTEMYRGSEYVTSMVPKYRLEVVCETVDVDDVVHTIATVAKTGKVGDGKIWVMPVSGLVRIRTAQTGVAAL